MRNRILSEATQAMEQTINAQAETPGTENITIGSKFAKIAAGFILVCILLSGAYFIKQSGNLKQPVFARGDFDRNGKVNILDAFKLARAIDAGDTSAGHWDLNRDGLVNAGDIDSIAYTAVKLDEGSI